MVSLQFFLKILPLHAKKSNAKRKGSRHETTTKMHNMEPIHNDPLNKACPQTKQK